MRNSISILTVLIFVSGLLLGCVFYEMLAIKLNAEVNISDILSILVTIFVGIYLGVTITSQQSSNRFEKEFLINETKRLTELLEDSRLLSDMTRIDHSDAIRVFKSINVALLSLKNMLDDSNYCQNIDTQEIRNSFQSLRRTVLDLPPTNGIILPTSSNGIKIAKSFLEFRRANFKTINKINVN